VAFIELILKTDLDNNLNADTLKTLIIMKVYWYKTLLKVFYRGSASPLCSCSYVHVFLKTAIVK